MLHVLQVDAPALIVADARGVDGLCGIQVGALVQSAEQLLEDRRLANDHVHEVDAAFALNRVLPVSHRDERRDRVRLVGQEDVLVGRRDVERQGDGEQDDPQHEEPAGGDELHRSPREPPPSTRTVVPLM